ncbi:MAG: hypothetical protein R6V02_10390 [Candidatus Aminicenantes bacterium]
MKNIFSTFMGIVFLFFTLAPPAPGQMESPASASGSRRMASWEQRQAKREASPFRGLHWQALGPRFQGGRVETIDAVPGTSIIYVGFGAGNVWKTENDGLTWTPIFEHQPTFTIGDLDVSDSHPEILYVGTGENLLARSSFAGLGVFKSTDGGKTWIHTGLADTHHIARVAVHPENPDIVYVAALGHEYSWNEDRGLFKTEDGGKSWKKVLYIDEKTGAVDVVMDPSNPSIVYAAANQHARRAWENIEHGEGSGVYKSEDAGRTWKRLTNGFPSGPNIGRIGLAAAPSDPNIIYAFLFNATPVETKTGEGTRTTRIGPEVYLSENAGASWRKVPMKSDIHRMGFFGDIVVSPENPDVFYALGQNLMRSQDRGQTFTNLHGTVIHLYSHPSRSLHLDQHDLWIDPTDPDRLILGNDGGIYLSRDRGETWLHLNNIPAGEFYALSLDDADPYHVYGGTQDNAALFGRADRFPEDGIEDEWSYVWIDLWGGGDSYITLVDPTNPDIIYFEQQFGGLQRKNMATGEITRIRPRAAEGEPELRYNWMSPFIISHHNPGILYFGANRLFKSLNKGDDWQAVSPDLSTQPGLDRQGNVPYGTITTISESPLKPGILYAGTDDGRVWVTVNDGVDWTEIGCALPDKWVSRVTASAHEEGSVYVTLTGYRENDFQTYIYKSSDFGQKWQPISNDLPEEQVNVIGEDPKDPDKLYIGTDQGGIYVTFDRGDSWTSLAADLPTTPIHDLAIQAREQELVIATHGRSFFKLDIAPVQAWTPETAAKPIHFFPVRPALLPQRRDYGGDWALEMRKQAVFHFALNRGQKAEIAVLNANDETVWRTFMDGRAGLNRAVWDLVTGSAYGSNRPLLHRGLRLAEPGTYRVTIKAGQASAERKLRIEAPDPVTIGKSRKKDPAQ